MNDHGKGSMRSSIRRQGARSWQVRVYNRTARKYEYFTVTGDMKDARDARNRRLAQIAKGSKSPPKRATKVTTRSPSTRISTSPTDLGCRHDSYNAASSSSRIAS